jgi:hypothetical protein
MKTGTTFLQNLMAANKDTLAEAGVLFPGRQWVDQDRAARDVLGFLSDPRFAVESKGMWQQVTAEMLAPGVTTSVFSMEFLSYADTEGAQRVVESFPDSEVHVILTVRDAIRAFPAQWQTQCANYGKFSWPRFLQTARQVIQTGEIESAAARKFQRTQGVPRMLDTWGPLVEPGRLHVVTVPPSGSDPMLLWRRFAEVVGVDPAACPIQPVHVNTSLGFASAELLRRVNLALGSVVRSDYDRVVKVRLARDVLSPRAGLEKRITLHRPGHNLAVTWNRRVRESILAHEADVVGSLDELPTQRAGADLPQQLERPDPDELLAAAEAARAGMHAYRRRLRGMLPGGDGEGPGDGPGGTPVPITDIQDGVEQVAGLVRDCLDLMPQVRGAPEPSVRESVESAPPA